MRQFTSGLVPHLPLEPTSLGTILKIYGRSMLTAHRSCSIALGLIPVLLTIPAFSATDYTQDPNMVSWWFLEEASGTRFDGSANGNNLTDNNGVGQNSV